MSWKQILAFIILFVIYSWLLLGCKVKYGNPIKTKYGYEQEYWLEIWGKRK